MLNEAAVLRMFRGRQWLSLAEIAFMCDVEEWRVLPAISGLLERQVIYQVAHRTALDGFKIPLYAVSPVVAV